MRRQQSVTAMRLRVTPIGAQGASAAKVAADVVDYLEGGRGDPGGALLGGGGGVVGYYADSREGPGRWLGAGAAFQRLSGRVDRDAFHRVLEGRHPVTGARLVTARGSSQRPHLAAGTAARFDELGRALYTVADAARLLGLRHDDVEELVEAGRGGDQDPADRGWLASVEIGGGPLISDAEIARHLELAATVVTASEVLREGDPDELLSVGQAARLLRVTPRYVRRLCSAYLSAETDGDGRRRASLRCHRADDGPAAPYRIRRGDLADFAGRRRPPVAVVGYDLTLTCEKSLAILTMLSDGEAQNRLVRALRVANDTAVAHLDRVASVARKGGAQIRTEGLLAASYFHGTSRALDPHPHHHNVVANAVVDAEGDVRTLDGRALYRHAPAAAALASAAVRWELRDLGVGWWRRDDGVWEIAGIDERAIREFSQRHHEVDEIKTVLEERLGRRLSHDEENTVALTTRGPKTRVEVDALRAAWQRRASDVGLDITSCFEHDGEVLVCDVLRCDLTDRLFADLVDPEHGLCATSTTFDRGDVLAMIADWSVVDADGHRRKVLLPPTEVERVADRFCASALVAELAGTAGAGVIRRRDGSVIRDGQAEPLFATVELLEVEHEILRRFAEQSPPRAVVDDTLVEAFVRTGDDDGVVLNGEQAQLVRAWCTSGRAIQAAVGRAGTGKTTTMQAARKAWQAGGFRVVGCAVKGEAARQLAEDAGIEADTVALLLARAAGGQQVLDERSVLIVDEASTLGSRDLVAILRLADTARATVRLIGDTAQHGSVSAGGSFAHLVDLDGDHTPQLTEVHRLRNRAERRRADLIRAGQIERALDELQASGQLRLTDSDADTYAAMLTRWYEHRHAGTAHPMVHGRNRERQLLNQLAQTVLASEGSVALDQAVTLRDGRRLAAGDDVIARRGDRRIYPAGQPKAWMRNGTTGRIVAVHHGGVPDDDRITIRTADGLLNCSRSVFDHRRGGIDLGYAVTSYAVQGSTRDASTSAVTATTARSELYVDITRGRHSNQLYATRTANRDDGEAHLPMLQRELMPTLRQQLARGIVRLASALDPTALAGAHQRRRRSLAALLAARQRREDGGVGRAIDQAIAATRREAQSSPQPTLRAVLPARPASPHLAARWDNFAGDVTVHTATTPAPRRRRRAQTAMEVLLGPRPDVHSESRHRWEELAERGAALAADIVVWQLQQARPPEAASIAGQSWLRPYLANLATNAGLAGVDLPALQQLIGDVDAWRSTHDVPPDDTAILGTIPAEAVDRAQFEQLCRRLRLGASSGGRSVA